MESDRRGPASSPARVVQRDARAPAVRRRPEMMTPRTAITITLARNVSVPHVLESTLDPWGACASRISHSLVASRATATLALGLKGDLRCLAHAAVPEPLTFSDRRSIKSRRQVEFLVGTGGPLSDTRETLDLRLIRTPPGW